MSACQSDGVAGTSLSPEGNITATLDVHEIVGGVVNTCPAVLQLAFAAVLESLLFVSSLSFAQGFVLFFFLGVLEHPGRQVPREKKVPMFSRR